MSVQNELIFLGCNEVEVIVPPYAYVLSGVPLGTCAGRLAWIKVPIVSLLFAKKGGASHLVPWVPDSL